MKSSISKRRMPTNPYIQCNYNSITSCYLILLLLLTIETITIHAKSLFPLRNMLLHSHPYHSSYQKRRMASKNTFPSSSNSNNGDGTDTVTTSSSLCSTKTEEEKVYDKNGFYYGDASPSEEQQQQQRNNYQYQSPPPRTMESFPSDTNNNEDPTIIQKFQETMNEFRENMEDMRDTLNGVRAELQELSNYLKQQQKLFPSSKPSDGKDGAGDSFTQSKIQKFDQMSYDIEDWANELIRETDGWKDVLCNKFFREKLNKNGNIKVFLKWLPDSRPKVSADEEENHEESKKEVLHPCMKIISTIDAPYEHVCSYLSNPMHMSEYNDLVIQHEDVEDITPYAKICWSSCPHILFLKPRDFVTFCCLKWKNGGDTQLVLSEAVDHDSLPGYDGEDEGDSDVDADKRYCRAFALRGANLISRHPEHYDKTLIILLAHANPGGNLPPWSVKTAVNALAPIEPFKICHKIEVGAQKLMATTFNAASSTTNDSNDMISSSSRSTTIYDRPGGLSQLGYACFWPHGGGLME